MAKLMRTRKWSFSLTLLVVICGATLLGGFYGSYLSGATMQNGDLQKRMKEYTDLLNAVSTYSADDVGSDKFVYASIDGMLRTLDPHTSFLEPKEYSDMQDRQKGTFFGLGILVTKRNDQVTVITPLEGTPAARLGIRAGDVIAEVEGVATDDLPLDDVVKRLKGPKGTTVSIKIKRVGMKEPIPLTITRAAIPTNSISNTLMIRPGVGYIRIKDFTSTTVRELDDGGGGEVLDADVADTRTDHQGVGDGVRGDGGAGDGERDRLFHPHALDLDADGGAFRALQALDDVVEREVVGGDALDLGDHVTSADAEACGRGA